MNRRLVPLPFLAMVCLWGMPATAQEPRATDPPAHISFVDGAAILERDGRTESDPLSMPLLAGDRVRTQGGRVEVLFADGTALHLDANTVVDFQSDDVMRLLEGRIRLSVAGPARNVSYRIDAPSAWVQINDPGEYRVSVLRDAEVELAVLRGSAELVNEDGRSFIRAGERTFARAGAAPSPPYVFNSAAWDSFDRWAESRRAQRLGLSAQYLPNDVRPYAAAFDAYGTWQYEQVYGYVWYPRVHVGWRPYHRGRWVSLRPFGWTWIAGDPWGWPTHHYGRWGVSAGAWFWIPGRAWSPAWVSWAYAPGYVSWCPLGWNNRPVLQIVNVNVYGGRRYNPWDAWTVVPRRHFTSGYVNVANVAASVRLDQRVHNTFVVRDTAPDAHYAIGRSAAPIRSAGAYAVPRDGVTSGVSRSAAPEAGRAAVGRSIDAGERRFPAAARAPGTPSTVQGGSPGADSRAPGERAISRERNADRTSSSSSSRAQIAPGPAADGAVRGYRSAPESGIRQRPNDAARDVVVTAPPAGAVRAIPRMRQPEEQSAVESRPGSDDRMYRQERARSYPSYSAPSYPSGPSTSSTPSTPAAARPSNDEPSDRGYTRSRANPDPGGESRGRSVPRYESPPPPSAYRAAPERREPSERPPAASPPPRSSGEGRAEGGTGRQRAGGDAAPSGHGVRRRR